MKGNALKIRFWIVCVLFRASSEKNVSFVYEDFAVCFVDFPRRTSRPFNDFHDPRSWRYSSSHQREHTSASEVTEWSMEQSVELVWTKKNTTAEGIFIYLEYHISPVNSFLGHHLALIKSKISTPSPPSPLLYSQSNTHHPKLTSRPYIFPLKKTTRSKTSEV